MIIARKTDWWTFGNSLIMGSTTKQSTFTKTQRKEKEGNSSWKLGLAERFSTLMSEKRKTLHLFSIHLYSFHLHNNVESIRKDIQSQRRSFESQTYSLL
jgi:predicted restriction endonuclease